MKKALILFLVSVMLANCFGIMGLSSDAAFCLVSSTVQSGEEEVDISPELEFAFSKEVDKNSLSSIALNGDISRIQSSQLDSSGKVLTLTLAGELSYYSYYTLNLSDVKDTNGNALGVQITFRTKSEAAADAFAIESSTVADGASSVLLNPTLSFDFNHRITLSGFTPSLNGDASYIQSAVISPDDDTVLNITLAKELAGNTCYTLNLSSLKDVYGSSFGSDISFTTIDNRVRYNIIEDDFEGTAIDTTKWRVSNKAELKTESGNGVVHIHNANSDASHIDNYNLSSYEMPGDVVVEFRMKIDENTVRTAFNFLNINNDSGSGNLMMQLRDDDRDGTWDLRLINKDGTYPQVNTTFKIGEWHKYAFVLNPLTGDYKFFFDETLISDSYAVKNISQSDKISYVRFNVYNADYGYYGFYVDDIKIAQRLALVPTAGGEYECFTDSDGSAITEVDPEKTVHKATFVNNGPADEAMHLFLGLYDADTNELKQLKQHSFTVEANSSYDVKLSFDNLGTKARNHHIKAIYVNNENEIKPYRNAMLPASELCLASPEE